MFRMIRKVRLSAQFIGARFEDYAELARLDAAEFGSELARTIVGYGVLATAGLLCICFASVAIIVTCWDTSFRIGSAWGVCALWAILAVGGYFWGRDALKPPTPFVELTAELAKDFQAIKEIE